MSVLDLFIKLGPFNKIQIIKDEEIRFEGEAHLIPFEAVEWEVGRMDLVDNMLRVEVR